LKFCTGRLDLGPSDMPEGCCKHPCVTQRLPGAVWDGEEHSAVCDTRPCVMPGLQVKNLSHCSWKYHTPCLLSSLLTTRHQRLQAVQMQPCRHASATPPVIYAVPTPTCRSKSANPHPSTCYSHSAFPTPVIYTVPPHQHTHPHTHTQTPTQPHSHTHTCRPSCVAGTPS
jgi:hypothetical protein